MAATESALRSLLTELFPHAAADVVLKENLIHLGGDSIMAAALASRLYQLWSMKFSVKSILQLENFAGLMAYLPAQTVEREAEKEVINTRDVYRQTDGQKMVYLETFRQPNTTAYNIPVIAELPIALSPLVVQQALQKVVKCFPAIFTHYYDLDGEFLFRYYEAETIPLIVYDNQQQAAQQFVQPFDLSKDCLLRAAVVPFDGDVTQVMLDFSHIIADGLSIGHFIRRLKAALYQKSFEGTAKTIFDFSRWTETAIYQAKFSDAAAFWHDCLGEKNLRPRWPGMRQASHTMGYGIQQAPIDALLAADIRQKAEQHQVTAFTLFLLGWSLLQSEVTGAWNSCVGLVASGRTEPEYYDTFGMFVNTLLLPVNFNAETSLQEALSGLAERTAAILEHQHYPFARQVGALQKGDDSPSPLDALFAFQNIDYQKIEIFGGRFRSFHQAKKMAQFGTVIQIFDLGEQGYDIQWEYAPERFSPKMVSGFLSHYQSIMSNIAHAESCHTLQQLLVIDVANTSPCVDLNVAEFNFGI
ncbi:MULTISPECIES: condensation domain-containing protein [Serratia]|uniref:condensation domain-containing protein n=1 Tax=Serratia TaxID=613 RepID=UPI000650829F|nr:MULTISPECIES: condensation domain-containing protein [Serratia]AVU36177.1 hypothetical protein AM681_16835 [Serratia marcescens]AVU41278.1 hypothetical protein AS658_16675 [Serratia marcescens]EGT0503041.1 hypothetical protein [Serratia marcescens]EHT9830698.1 hypothetical protein [Serratia marcescens]EIU0886596.1 hypothetical protein [Serratia marcescens]